MTPAPTPEMRDMVADMGLLLGIVGAIVRAAAHENRTGLRFGEQFIVLGVLLLLYCGVVVVQ